MLLWLLPPLLLLLLLLLLLESVVVVVEWVLPLEVAGEALEALPSDCDGCAVALAAVVATRDVEAELPTILAILAAPIG